jgi:hypothetical protein
MLTVCKDFRAHCMGTRLMLEHLQWEAWGKCCRYVRVIISSSVFHLSFYGMEISELLKGIISDKERGKILTDIPIFINDTSFNNYIIVSFLLMLLRGNSNFSLLYM